MHPYRTHTCNELRLEHEHMRVKLSGWIHRKRDHGNLLFIDLRDHYGISSVCHRSGQPAVRRAPTNARVRRAWSPSPATSCPATRRKPVNPNLPTGQVEVVIEEFNVESPAEVLPMQVAGDGDYGEETRLRYRFLDLRREHVHAPEHPVLRGAVISSIRQAHDPRRVSWNSRHRF